MAHKKAGGSTRNGRDSESKRLGVKRYGGQTVTGGTINGGGALTIRVTATGEDTTLARIIALVEEAQGARLPVQDLVNRITLWFVPAIMALGARPGLSSAISFQRFEVPRTAREISLRVSPDFTT